MPREIEDSVAVVTGASSGIGRATARAMAERGARVMLAARSEKSLQEVAEECEMVGWRALVVPTDVTDEEAVRELARRSVEGFGRIDVWVNNAGVMFYGRFEGVPTEVYRRTIETNLSGQIHGARAALSHFLEQGGGVLINMSSVWGRLTSPPRQRLRHEQVRHPGVLGVPQSGTGRRREHPRGQDSAAVR
jgi:NADP-dependent 3-hydroxy acid dehydrogenase YdfG